MSIDCLQHASLYSDVRINHYPITKSCGNSDRESQPLSASSNSSSSIQNDLQTKQEIQKLKRIDQQVRAHEMAHVAAGGQYISGGVNFQYKIGPDGKQYAVGGEVSIDTSAIAGNPQATITKMMVVQRAANAPADPSSQDRTVAQQAAKKLQEAQLEQTQQKQQTQQAQVETDQPLNITEKSFIDSNPQSRWYAAQKQTTTTKPVATPSLIDISA